MSEPELRAEGSGTFDFLAIGGTVPVCVGCGQPIEPGQRFELICTSAEPAPNAVLPMDLRHRVGINERRETDWRMFNLIHPDCEWTTP